MSSLKETKELLSAAFNVAAVLIPVLREQKSLGAKVEDVATVLLSEKVVADVKLAIEGAAEIDDELGGAGIFDSLDLARFALAKVKELKAVLAPAA